jgi:hypothetical protein
VERQLAKALTWLKGATATRGGKLRTLASALFAGGGDGEREALERMQLAAPKGAGEWLEARLLLLALAKTGQTYFSR